MPNLNRFGFIQCNESAIQIFHQGSLPRLRTLDVRGDRDATPEEEGESMLSSAGLLPILKCCNTSLEELTYKKELVEKDPGTLAEANFSFIALKISNISAFFPLTGLKYPSLTCLQLERTSLPLQGVINLLASLNSTIQQIWLGQMHKVGQTEEFAGEASFNRAISFPRLHMINYFRDAISTLEFFSGANRKNLSDLKVYSARQDNERIDQNKVISTILRRAPSLTSLTTPLHSELSEEQNFNSIQLLLLRNLRIDHLNSTTAISNFSESLVVSVLEQLSLSFPKEMTEQ